MLLDFRNTNTLWASVAVETLSRLGLTSAIICPGSRSTPLTVAFARHRKIKAIPILDERSAAFFALGIAKRTGLPVALVCTSGTAGANFYPAIIEAKESRVPLIVITADRPPELRHCHAGQTIDQVKLFGNYPNWQTELAVPDLDLGMLRYLRQTTIYAWERSRFPTPGVVHLNFPFRDPLAPTPQPNTATLQAFDWEDFFAFTFPSSIPLASFPIPQEWLSCQRGIIIAGIAHSHAPKEYCQAIAMLSQSLQYPVFAEALSPLRNYADLNPYLITTYDPILRHEKLARQLTPEIVIQLGELPTSKELRTWLETIQPHRWIVDPSAENFDSLHGKSVHLRVGVEQLENSFNCYLNTKDNSYLQQWCDEDLRVRQKIDQTMQSIDVLLESKVSWLLSQTLPPHTPIFIANSMSVRNMEFFWMPGNSGITPYFNRGANGIDGTLSTALGIAYRDCPKGSSKAECSSILLTGDLAVLHDTNGFLIQQKFIGHLTIILINNNGGGIFEMLPISQFEPPFEDFFATPQNIDFAKLCQTYNIEHKLISSWEQLKQLLNPLPETGIRVLEIKCDRKADARWLQDNLKQFSIFDTLTAK